MAPGQTTPGSLVIVTELETILESIQDWSQRDIAFALATVVGVRGSTYRGLAARQLVAADGASVGTVSGGCLDADLHQVACAVIESGQPSVIEFDLTADDEAVWGWGIGCNGATELLVEPAHLAEALAGTISSSRAAQRPLAIVHVVRPGSTAAMVGARRYVHLDGTASETLGDGQLDRAVVEPALAVLASGHNEIVEQSGARLMIEAVGAPSRLVVCGAGHDASPLVRYAVELGLEVFVVDDRRQFLTRERFGEAARLVHSRPAELTDHIETDARTYVVVMSHNYLRDLDYLRSLVGTDVAYIGMLGPGARLERIIRELEKEGHEISERDLAKLHGPAGLDVGAEGPAEIAWSIMAEILAVRRDRDAGFLRLRKGPDAVRRLP